VYIWGGGWREFGGHVVRNQTVGITVSDQSLSKHTMSNRKALWWTIKKEKSRRLRALRKVSHSTYKEPLRGGLREGKRGLKHLWAQRTL